MFRKEIETRIKFSGGWANNHSHLCRVYTINHENLHKSQMDLQRKWELVSELKKNATVSGMEVRMARFIEEQIQQGVTSLTTFLDFDFLSKEKPFTAFSKIRDMYGKDIKLRCANQTLHGVLEPIAYDWFLKGSEVSDVVGGLPGKNKGYEREHMMIVLNRAKELGKTAHLHIGQFQDPNCMELETLIECVEDTGMQGRVAAIHCLSIACKPKEHRIEVYKKMKQNEISVIACPVVWADSPSSETLVPFHNSVAPIKEMLEYDINIGIGTDNTACLMNPLGENNMYDEIKMLAHLCRIYDLDRLSKIGSTRID